MNWGGQLQTQPYGCIPWGQLSHSWLGTRLLSMRVCSLHVSIDHHLFDDAVLAKRCVSYTLHCPSLGNSNDHNLVAFGRECRGLGPVDNLNWHELATLLGPTSNQKKLHRKISFRPEIATSGFHVEFQYVDHCISHFQSYVVDFTWVFLWRSSRKVHQPPPKKMPGA